MEKERYYRTCLFKFQGAKLLRLWDHLDAEKVRFYVSFTDFTTLIKVLSPSDHKISKTCL